MMSGPFSRLNRARKTAPESEGMRFQIVKLSALRTALYESVVLPYSTTMFVFDDPNKPVFFSN